MQTTQHEEHYEAGRNPRRSCLLVRARGGREGPGRDQGSFPCQVNEGSARAVRVSTGNVFFVLLDIAVQVEE